jgi:hypothetical protein
VVVESRARLHTSDDTSDLEQCLLKQAKLHSTGSLANFLRVSLLTNNQSALIAQYECEIKRQEDSVWEKLREISNLRKRTIIRLRLDNHELTIANKSLSDTKSHPLCGNCGARITHPDVQYPNKCVSCALQYQSPLSSHESSDCYNHAEDWPGTPTSQDDRNARDRQDRVHDQQDSFVDNLRAQEALIIADQNEHLRDLMLGDPHDSVDVTFETAPVIKKKKKKLKKKTKAKVTSDVDEIADNTNTKL